MTDPVQFYDMYVEYCTSQWNYRRALEVIDFCLLEENNQEAVLKSSVLSLSIVLQLSSNYCNFEISDETF